MGLRTSSTALASYMKDLFGDKPEPWLVDGYVPPEDLTVDFDGGHASGLAIVSESQIEDFVNGNGSEPMSSPLVRARAKALKRGERVEDGEGVDGVEGAQPVRSRAHMSGTPMAWATPAGGVTSVRPKRSGLTVALVASLFVGGGAFAIIKRPWESGEVVQVTPAAGAESTAPEPKPAGDPPKVEATEPMPAEPKATESKATESKATESKATESKLGDSSANAAVEPPKPDEQPAAAVAAAKGKTPVPAKRKGPTTKKTKTAGATATGTGSGSSWNPDTLLPE
jgi:hypothetical protein